MKKLLDINIDWNSLLRIVSVTIGSGGIAGLLILWVRHKKEDSAKAKKTLAEAEEIEGRSALIRLERDERVFEISTKLVEKLSEECEVTKKELDFTLKQLHEVRLDLDKANKRCKELEDSLYRERESNKLCATEIEQLRIELEKIRREDRRRPT